MELIGLLEKVQRDRVIDMVLDGYHGGDGSLEVGRIRTRPESTGPKVLKRIDWPNGVDMIAPRVALHAPAVLYLRGRGVDDQTMVERKLGFGRFGRLRDRIVFPCFMDGALVYWQARATWDAKERDDDYRKTVNPYGASSMSALFGFDTARTHREVVICEGPMDAIKCGPHAVALLGKTAQPGKLARLVRMRATRYTVYLDPDAQEQARTLARHLSAYAPTYIATCPPNRDPGDLSEAENCGIVRNAEPYSQKKLSNNM